MGRFFVQMSGAPGAGKTTVARGIAGRTGALIVDQDIAKSALLEAGVPASLAGKASYRALGATAGYLLAQGYSVIFDSPCYYEELLAQGQRLAREAGVAYLYIECVVEDLDELDRRLRGRPRLASQMAGVRLPPPEGTGKALSGDDVFREWIANMKRPEDGYLALDTSRPPEACIEEAVAYLERRAAGPP